MPGIDFFARLGLFVKKSFLERDQCARLCAEARAAAAERATIVRGREEFVDESSRKTKVADVTRESIELVESRLRGLMPELMRHFQVPLTGCEPPQFLVYGPGEFFGTHQDSSEEREKPSYVKERKVSTVIFLNDQSEDESRPGTYGHGALSLYGLVPQPKWEKYGFPLSGEAGLLVAFPSHVWHAVEPVSRGERFTIVSWFY